MVNHIKIEPLKLKLIAKLCGEVEANCDNVLLHSDTIWLFRGKALLRIHEMKDEMPAFLVSKNTKNFVICFAIII